MPKYIAAIDQGTTSTRCILFDRDGPVASAQREHAQIFPRPGWVEHDPLEIWARTQDVIREAMLAAEARAVDVAAIGITNQRETTVVWDGATGKPVCNAIVWQDTRTKEICDALAVAGGQDRFRDATGLPLATYFAGPKIRWILDSIPGVRSAAAAGNLLFGTIDTWLIWNLTRGPHGGQHVTDPTNASRTMLMNLRTLEWDEQLLRAFDVPGSMLPRIIPSGGCMPDLRSQIPDLAGVPIRGILGDQQAALVGQCCFTAGECKNTYGTGSFLLLNTGHKIVHSTAGLLTTVACHFPSLVKQGSGVPEGREAGSPLNPELRTSNPPTYALEGSIAVTGSLVQWLRDSLNLIRAAPEIEPLAASVNDNGGVYIVPAFSGLFAPYWRSDARGVICGLTRHSNRAHLARAVLEATAYQTRDVLEAMRKDAGIDIQSLKVDGGMCVNNLLMQFQADILGAPVTRPRFTETTAQGAAYAAGLAVGFWKDFDDLRSHWKPDKTWTPTMPQEQRDLLYASWKKAVERSFGWVD